MKPCKKCGATDRYADGACRPCKLAWWRQQYLSEKPCPKCGSLDRMKSGPCRPCSSAVKKRLRETRQPCRVCGSEDRKTNGGCRPCNTASVWRLQGVKSRRDPSQLITWQEFKAACQAAGGKCAICGETPEKGLVMDHCHDTLVFRAPICQPCNVVLGAAKDRVPTLLNAALYLIQHGRESDTS